MIVVICGGRDYKFNPADLEMLSEMHNKINFELIITGGARGADTEANLFARRHSIPLKVFNANWKLHGKSAGPIRNKIMLDYLLTFHDKNNLAVIAFPGGRGTQNMVSIAKESGVKIFIPYETKKE